MNTASILDEVRTRFLQLDLHDSRLLEIRLRHRAEAPVDDLTLEVLLLKGKYPEYKWEPAELTFLDCTYLKLEVDLAMKLVCGDAIAGSTCSTDSELRRELEHGLMQQERNPLAEYIEFVVGLCPPAGELHIFARDFALSLK